MLVRTENKIIRKEAGFLGDVDDNWVYEITSAVLDIRRNQIKSLVNSLARKVMRGEDLSAEKLASSSVIDQMIRDSLKEFSHSYYDGDMPIISTATRKAAKKELAEEILARVDKEVEGL